MSLLSQLLTKPQKVSSGIFLKGPIVAYSKESLTKLQYFGNCQLFCSGNDFVIPPCTIPGDVLIILIEEKSNKVDLMRPLEKS